MEPKVGDLEAGAAAEDGARGPEDRGVVDERTRHRAEVVGVEGAAQLLLLVAEEGPVDR
jgi:hypothetical protein